MLARFRGINGRLLLIPLVAVLALIAVGVVAVHTVGAVMLDEREARARVIVEAFPELDGVRYNSRFCGHPCAALFLPAAAAMPNRPALSLPLTHPGLVSRLAGAARRLGYSVI